MKTNLVNGKFSTVGLQLTATICFLTLLSVSIFVPVQSAETTVNEPEIIHVVREGPHETVLIANLTREKIDLCDYLLKAEKAGLSFDFEKEAECKSTLAPLSLVRVHTGSGSSEYYASWNDIPWTQKEVWDDESDKATLVGPDGDVISSFSYGEDYE